MIIAFLLFILVIAFYAIETRVTSFRPYAVGNRTFSTPNLIATVLATYYGGGTMMGYMTRFSDGIFWVSWRIFGVMAACFMLSWLSMRMANFIYHISMPETMGRVYGKYPRIITAVLNVCYSTVVIAMQIHIMSQAIGICITSASPLSITILSTLLVLAYAIFGGVRAIVLTDVGQFITFSILICCLAWFMFKQTNVSFSETIVLTASQKKFGLSYLLLHDRKLVATLRYLSTFFYCIEPTFVHNIYMSSSPYQSKKVFLYAGILGAMLMVCVSLVGLFIFRWVPSNLSQTEIWDYIMAHSPPLLKGVVCTCILAMTMSTADSRLHISAVIISYDIVPNILPMRLRKRLSFVDHYRIAHMAILFLAAVSIPLALTNSYFIADQFSRFYGRLYAPLIVAPFILAVLGFRTTQRTVLIGMVAGVLSVFGWRKWIYPLLGTTDGLFPCMLVNGLVMLAVHHLWPDRKHIKVPMIAY